jgi:lipid II:glycine glycyltransferase (peptidoglycan interpeptide bridge formation enzyme)
LINTEFLNITLELVSSGLTWSQNLAEFNFSLFVTGEWIESFADDNKQPVYFNFYYLNEIVAKISGLIISFDRYRVKKLYFFSGPAMKTNDSSLYQACVKSLITFARDHRMNRIIIRSYDYSTLIEEPIPGLKISNREEFVLDLNPDKDTLVNNMGKKVVKNYRKALNMGYSFNYSNSGVILDKLIELLEATQQFRTGKGYHKYAYLYFQYMTRQSLEKLIKSGAIMFYYAEKDGTIDCINLVMMKDGRAYGLLSGATPESYKYGVPSFVKYSLINHLKDLHFSCLNLGGTPKDHTHDGISTYKLTLGCKAVRKSGFSTNYLFLPYSMMNPILNLGRKLPDTKLFQSLKKYI